jgi:hypothetical protein
MTETIQRVSLVAQLASVLRQELAAGVWSRSLPVELTLCEHFRVSRVTLSAALAQLEQEGWLKAKQGCRRQIVRTAGRDKAMPLQKRVVLLSPLSLRQVTPERSSGWTNCAWNLGLPAINSRLISSTPPARPNPPACLCHLDRLPPGRLLGLVPLLGADATVVRRATAPVRHHRLAAPRHRASRL